MPAAAAAAAEAVTMNNFNNNRILIFVHNHELYDLCSRMVFPSDRLRWLRCAPHPQLHPNECYAHFQLDRENNLNYILASGSFSTNKFLPSPKTVDNDSYESYRFIE